MINNIVSRISVGSRCKDQDMLLELIREGMDLSGGFDVSDLFQSITLLPRITGTRKKMEMISKKKDAILNNIILEHKERHASHANEESDTSSVTVEWAMSELMKNPRVMKKAQDELRHVLKGKAKIQESDMQELDYLKKVIKETLRLNPPLPFLLPRECREDCEIGGFHIPIKTKVIINAWMIGRDPDYWIDPESFVPERFSKSTLNIMGTNFEYLPFGAGRRMCPGILLGLANVELPLAMLLYHFDWELPSGPTSKNFDMFESFGATLKRKNDLLLVPHPYNTNY
ncbi:putative oxidoreductase [Helianthus anomalus]